MAAPSLGNILLIDDNPKLLKDALPMYGYHTDTATDGVLGLEYLEKNYRNTDLVLLDIMMPKMDGLGGACLDGDRNVARVQLKGEMKAIDPG